MTHEEAQAWAEQWIAEWNRRDVEAVLGHFADDVEFCSPLVVSVTGEPSGIVRGRAALRDYWVAALAERLSTGKPAAQSDRRTDLAAGLSGAA